MNKKKVLVVDDENDAVEYMKAILEEKGYAVLSANNGTEGISKAKETQPDIILLDVQMPGEDGFHIFYEMRHDEELKTIPIVMVTGIAKKTGIKFSADEMEGYFHVRPEGYIEKPFEPENVIATIEKILT